MSCQLVENVDRAVPAFAVLTFDNEPFAPLPHPLVAADWARQGWGTDPMNVCGALRDPRLAVGQAPPHLGDLGFHIESGGLVKPGDNRRFRSGFGDFQAEAGLRCHLFALLVG